MKNIVIIASYAPSICLFRKELILAMLKQANVTVLAPYANEQTTAEIRALGVNYQVIPLSRRGMNPLLDLKLLWSLCKILRRIKPDKVLCYTIKPVVYGLVAARLVGIPERYALITGLGYAFTALDTFKRKLLHKIIKHMYTIALMHSKVIFFQNTDDMNFFQRLGIIRNQPVCLVNGSGINTDYFAFHQLEKVETVRFLMIARLLQDKGIYEYLGAAKMIKARYPDVECHLVGFLDDDNSNLKQAIDDVIASEAIIFHGELNDVRQIIQHTSVYVLPSYREGTPRSVLEAMSTGRAIITTDAPGCRETVIDGYNGFLIPVKEVNALFERMEQFIQNPDLCIKMGQAGRKIAQQKYDVYTVTAVILEAMELCGDKKDG